MTVKPINPNWPNKYILKKYNQLAKSYNNKKEYSEGQLRFFKRKLELLKPIVLKIIEKQKKLKEILK